MAVPEKVEECFWRAEQAIKDKDFYLWEAYMLEARGWMRVNVVVTDLSDKDLVD